MLAAGLAAEEAAVDGAEVHAEAAFDTRIGLSRRSDIVLHNRARVRASSGNWYDVSLIPIYRYKVNNNLMLFGGSFFTWIRPANSEASRALVVRPFGGVEPSLHWERWSLAARSGYERFLAIDGPDYNRYRQRFRIIRRNGWTPYGNIELFWLNSGHSTTRYGAGFRRDFGKRDGIEFTYWYETRIFTGGGIRHVFAVTFHLNFKGLAPDW